MLTITPVKGEDGDIVSMKLVHGCKVTLVGEKDKGKIIENCDGLVTNTPEVSLRLSAADCIPVSLYDPITNSIGLIHAGWRGLYKGVIDSAVSLMEKKLKVRCTGLVVFIGPYICQKHYEVKDDVYTLFAGYTESLKRTGRKTFLDLGGVAKKQLINAGVKPEKIFFDGRCTCEDRNLFSFRRGDVGKYMYYILKIPRNSS